MTRGIWRFCQRKFWNGEPPGCLFYFAEIVESLYIFHRWLRDGNHSWHPFLVSEMKFMIFLVLLWSAIGIGTSGPWKMGASNTSNCWVDGLVPFTQMYLSVGSFFILRKWEENYHFRTLSTMVIRTSSNSTWFSVRLSLPWPSQNGWYLVQYQNFQKPAVSVAVRLTCAEHISYIKNYPTSEYPTVQQEAIEYA